MKWIWPTRAGFNLINAYVRLEDELNTVLTSLDTERRLREAGDQNIEALRMTIQGLEQDLRSLVEEQNSQKEFLEHEKKLRIRAENKYSTACQELQALQEENFRLENDRIIRIQNLEEELELERNLKHSIEKQETLPANEKIRAEPAVKESSDELQPVKNVIGETGVEPLKQAVRWSELMKNPGSGSPLSGYWKHR